MYIIFLRIIIHKIYSTTFQSTLSPIFAKNNSKINSSSATHPLKRIDTPQIQTEPFPLFEIKYIYIYTYTSISLLAHLTVFIRERRPGARHHLRGTDIPTYRGRRQTTCPPLWKSLPQPSSRKNGSRGYPCRFPFYLPSLIKWYYVGR